MLAYFSTACLLEQYGFQQTLLYVPPFYLLNRMECRKLPLILSGNTTHDRLQATMTILWYIWKARNDLRFNNKKWTVWHVYSCTAAEIRMSSLSMNAVDQKHMPNGMNASLADP
jgi:hypothetical protein